MLIISLILTASLLAVVNWIAYRSKKPSLPILGVCLVFLMGPPFFNLYLPGVALQAVLSFFALLERRSARLGPSYFLKLSVAATLIALGVTGVQVFQTERGYAQLRARYPFESMEERLPTPKPSPREKPVALDALGLFASLEYFDGGYRSYQLKMLHEDAVGLFIDSAGFGFSRMPRLSESSLAMRPRPVPLQPGPRLASTSSPGEWMPPTASDEQPLARLFVKSVGDFINSRGFGYLKDRRHVAGFESHRFSEVPEPTERWPKPSDRWQVQTLDLVGLILHDKPQVYVSDHLPSMDELRAAPTRPLDKFESVGLNAMRGGDDLLIARVGDVTRMLYVTTRNSMRIPPAHLLINAIAPVR